MSSASQSGVGASVVVDGSFADAAVVVAAAVVETELADPVPAPDGQSCVAVCEA